ncbi:MAG: hypothetical protein WC279_10775 [Sulfurimonas sp.]|jgi:hypothetical protein|uniref:hypothetical protein n=1 Tax=Sulfurimonas sp. TaxID=2022749 RepID=UPI003566A48B
MYLSKKAVGLLLFPFILSALAYYFSPNIINCTHSFFPVHEQHIDKNLDKKMQKYLEIESKQNIYQKIGEDALRRENNVKWVVDELLYVEKTKVSQKLTPLKKATPQVEPKAYTYQLQAIFSDDKTALINDSFVKEGSKVNDATIKEIREDRVLIQTEKGAWWLFLFQ